MNVLDILKYGNLTLLKSVEGLPEEKWEVGGVCGVWSVKDIMAHLASFELMLAEALDTLLGAEFGLTMSEMAQLGATVVFGLVFGALALGTGGRLDNFILVGEDNVINTELRFPDEFVRHKILDIIGDLYLLGYPMRGRVTAKLTGHRDNIVLQRQILEANAR